MLFDESARVVFRGAHGALRAALLLIAVLVPWTGIAFAQSSATLSGVVVDDSGAALAAAAVTVTNAATMLQRQVKTGNDGQFAPMLLPPGRYVVRVQQSGFTPIEVPDVVLNVNDQIALRLEMKVAAVEEAVAVVAEARRVSTSPAVSTVIDRKFVENLPMNGRSLQSLILLTPGVVTNTPQSAAAVGYSGEFGVNGQRTESNRFSVDGLSANNGTYVYGYQTPGTAGSLPTGTTLGTTQSLVSVDALEEFRATTSSYSAEHGRSPGGQISLITRSGTNDWHGSAFNYFRSDALDANDWFNNRLGVAKPEQRQNDFGATFGGPVRLGRLYDGRDRTFFFVSYEGMRIQQPQAARIGYVPTVWLRESAPAPLREALAGYPLPTGPELGNGLAEYVYSDSVPSSLDATSVRLDQYVGQHRIFFRLSHAPSESTTRAMTEYSRREFGPRSYNVGVTSLFSPRISNELRVGYSPNEGAAYSEQALVDGAQPIDLPGAQGVDLAANPSAYVYVGLYFPGYSSTVGASNPGTQLQNQWNVIDTMTMVYGRHQVKLGFDYLRTASTLQRTNPYIYALFGDVAGVQANRASQAALVLFGRSHPVYTSYALFAQDEWRLTSRLSLSLGLRWEVNPPPSVSDGVLPRVLSGDVSQPSSLSLAPEGTPPMPTTYNNFGPRLGVSYVLRDTERYQTVVRGGAGIFFDNGQNLRMRIFDSSPGAQFQRNYGGTTGIPAGWPLAPELIQASLEDSLRPPYSTVYQFPDLKLPYTWQWNGTIEQEVGSHQSVTLSYVGARGHRLLSETSVNMAALNPSFTYIYLIRNALTSNYDSLQMQYQRRLSRGLQALASYTWGHAIDYGSQNGALEAKRGHSDYDLRHSFSAAVTYTLPTAFTHPVPAAVLHGWSIDGRFSSRSAFPVTLNGRSLTDPTGQAYYGGLDLVPGQPLYLERADLPGGRQINPAAFALPVGNEVGNAPRNVARGFGATQLDMSLRRDFAFGHGVRIQARLEAFNVFNHPIFGTVNNTFGNALFGQATRSLNSSLGGLNALYQQGGPRSMQLSLKVVF